VLQDISHLLGQRQSYRIVRGHQPLHSVNEPFQFPDVSLLWPIISLFRGVGNLGKTAKEFSGL
jgi:hypothetical protein